MAMVELIKLSGADLDRLKCPFIEFICRKSKKICLGRIVWQKCLVSDGHAKTLSIEDLLGDSLESQAQEQHYMVAV